MNSNTKWNKNIELFGKGKHQYSILAWTRLSNLTFTFHFHALEKEMATHSSVLSWRIQERGSLVGCHLWAWVQSVGWEDTLEKGMATHSSILARKIHGQRSLLGYSP